MVAGASRTLERKIHFYRVRKLIASDPDFDPVAAANAISNLAFGDGQRYLEAEDGNAICVWPIATAPRVHMRLGVVRRSSLPFIEDAGNVTPLTIGPRQGLLEPIHIVFLPNGIVGSEFNFYGPRLSRLGAYFREKLPSISRVSFDILLRQDIQEQLAHFKEIRIAQLRLHRSQLDLVRQADQSLFDAFEAAGQASGASSIEVVVRPERYARRSLSERVLGWVNTLARTAAINEAAEVFRVQALDDRTNKYEWFDLLKDQLVVTRSVQAESDARFRGVSPTAMFSTIETVYQELRDTLDSAAGIR